jgi:hypothetical protein
MKAKEAAKGRRAATESKKFDDRIRDALEAIRGTKKYHSPRDRY